MYTYTLPRIHIHTHQQHPLCKFAFKDILVHQLCSSARKSCMCSIHIPGGICYCNTSVMNRLAFDLLLRTCCRGNNNDTLSPFVATHLPPTPPQGRGGLGSLFVWAGGNGGSRGDNCNCDGYVLSPYTIAVSSVSERDQKPWYVEECSSTLTSTYSSGGGDEKMIVSVFETSEKCQGYD